MTRRSNQRICFVMSIVLMACVSPASAKVIYVDANAPGPTYDGSNWANAYNYLQDALADAGSATKPVEIRAAQGIYKPDQATSSPPPPPPPPPPPGSLIDNWSDMVTAAITAGDREATFQLINGVTIKGNYAGFAEPDPNARDIGLYETIMSGDLAGNDTEVDDLEYLLIDPCRADNSFHVVTGDYTDETAVIDGFIITAGNASESSSTPHSSGGGMYSYEGSATITNCKFSYNAARNKGGGMLNDNYLSGCEFCIPKIENCTFIYNWSRSGGGMYNWVSNPTISNCKFIGNVADSYSSRGGGMRNFYSNPILKNCLFLRNSAESVGGGMANGQSSPELTNCTFSGNSAFNGGGMENNQSNPVLTNCILWGNINGQIQGSAIISYSDVEGGWSGLGNIDTDPCFADANNGDYHLKSQAGRWDPNSQSWIKDDVTSPCIDAANPGCPVGDEPAPNGNRRNMGAYGGTAEASKSPANWRSIADITNDWAVDSNDLKVLVGYWLQTGDCIPSDFDRSLFVDFNDFAILGGQWHQKGPGPGITYETGGCIPVDFASSVLGESDPTRFTVTVEGQYILFEDMMRANCCPDELELQMTAEDNLITIDEIEHLIGVPCPCICDYPITATLGPFEPGIYTLEVYEDGTFIGTTTVTIAPGS